MADQYFVSDSSPYDNPLTLTTIFTAIPQTANMPRALAPTLTTSSSSSALTSNSTALGHRPGHYIFFSIFSVAAITVLAIMFWAVISVTLNICIPRSKLNASGGTSNRCPRGEEDGEWQVGNNGNSESVRMNVLNRTLSDEEVVNPMDRTRRIARDGNAGVNSNQHAFEELNFGFGNGNNYNNNVDNPIPNSDGRPIHLPSSYLLNLEFLREQRQQVERQQAIERRESEVARLEDAVRREEVNRVWQAENGEPLPVYERDELPVYGNPEAQDEESVPRVPSVPPPVYKAGR